VEHKRALARAAKHGHASPTRSHCATAPRSTRHPRRAHRLPVCLLRCRPSGVRSGDVSLGGSRETASETRRRSWVTPRSLPSTAGSVSDRLSELTPLFEVANEARDVGELPPDASP
jgi:hypothetical protein